MKFLLIFSSIVIRSSRLEELVVTRKTSIHITSNKGLIKVIRVQIKDFFFQINYRYMRSTFLIINDDRRFTFINFIKMIGNNSWQRQLWVRKFNSTTTDIIKLAGTTQIKNYLGIRLSQLFLVGVKLKSSASDSRQRECFFSIWIE